MYYVFSENKAADELRDYRATDPHLLFSHMQIAGFLMMQLNGLVTSLQSLNYGLPVLLNRHDREEIVG